MGWQIIKQEPTDEKLAGQAIEPGKYAIFSSVVDSFIAFNMTREELIKFHEDNAAKEAREHIKKKLKVIDSGKPAYHQFTTSFASALAMSLGQDDEDDEDDDAEEDEEDDGDE